MNEGRAEDFQYDKATLNQFVRHIQMSLPMPSYEKSNGNLQQTTIQN